MSWVVHKEGGFSLFYFLFRVVFDLFQPILACPGLLRVVPPFTSDGVKECFGFQICRKLYVGFRTNW